MAFGKNFGSDPFGADDETATTRPALAPWMVSGGNAIILGSGGRSELEVEPFPIGQGCRLPVIRTQLIGDDDLPADLTDAVSIVFRFLKNDVLLFSSAALAEGDPTDGVVRYEWAVGDTDRYGAFDAEWIVTYSDGREETFPGNRFNRVFIRRRR